MRGRIWIHAFVLSLVATGALVGPVADLFTEPVEAQVPAPVQDALNSTTNATEDQDQYALVHIRAHPTETFLELDEKGVTQFPISIEDRSAPGQSNVASSVSVRCDAVASNETPIERGWAFSTQFIPPVSREQTTTTEVSVVAGPFASPEYLFIDVICEAFSPFQREIGNFTLVAKVRPYTYMQLVNVGVLPAMGPDEEFVHQVQLTNLGNQITTFVGRVRAPDGWEVTIQDSVTLRPGESRVINITGVTPRDQLVYLSKAEILNVEFFPLGEEGRARSLPFVAQVNGVYVHPAIAPVVVLALVILSAIIFLAVLARRAIEEQILGKPVPPWRIPVEREHLNALEKEDPDQFYIVRYYLMVEEHESALLWFHAYKRATKKDRKKERAWFKVKGKQERKVRGVEKEHAKVVRKWDRKDRGVEKKRDRKLRKLERKLRRGERKEARGLDKKHKKRVKKIKKKHKKRAKKVLKKHEKTVAKETKKVERQNRKLAKKGEELLPLPEIPAPEIEEPELPEKVPVEETPLDESRYAKRAERIRARADAKLERLRLRREKHVAKSRLQADIKIEKLEAKIPPEPKTHLYDAAEYVPEDEVIVEDDRPFLAKMLHVPTLEERERVRRRRAVYQARLKQAKAAEDPARVDEVKRQLAEEMAAMKEARREDLAAARAGSAEAARLKKERRRQAKERAKERKAAARAPTSAAPEEASAEEGAQEVPPEAPRKRLGLKVPIRQKERADEPAPQEATAPDGAGKAPQQAAPSPSEAAEADDADTEAGGFRARFKRRPKEAAGSEEHKKEPSESPEAHTQGKE